MSELTGLLFGEPGVDAAFSDRARLVGMLRFEAALAAVQARLGVIPAGAAGPIAATCDAGLYPISDLAAAARLSGNLAIPLVKMLTAKVVAADAQAGAYVHWGATSQDVIDTGLSLQIAEAAKIVAADLDRLIGALARLARDHAGTVMVARTLLQHALPTTLGLKAAGWLDSARFARAQVAVAAAQAAQLQFGGAAGTLASLEGRGLEVSGALALELGLPQAALPWHARRERIAALGGAIAMAIGVLGKIGGDLLLMMQTEVGEAFEPAAPGKGGSSAMPHKRNPVGLVAIGAAARRAPGLAATLFAAMPQEHERGAGGWHAEWETLPELFRLLGGAASHAAEIVAGLELDTDRMRANLGLTQGLLFGEGVALALAPALGKARAQALVEAASKTALAQGRSLAAVLREAPEAAAVLTDDQWRDLFDPAQRLGSAKGFVARVLEVK